ncbi:MAG: rod shape-determining protein MreD [Spirochaetaceae bacterium]|nr:MAG: rod shape-determining protein MreD [Spirochaetaceae bacterium]
MIGKIVRAVLLAALMGILQTNALRFVSPAAVIPDLALIILVFFAHRNGSFPGQIAGFFTGLLLDFLSLAPLGFFAFIYTVIGFVFGATKDRIVLDGVVLPFVALFLATLVKILTAGALAGVFSIETASIGLLSSRAWIEIGLTALLAPLLFALMSMMGIFHTQQRGGFR